MDMLDNITEEDFTEKYHQYQNILEGLRQDLPYQKMMTNYERECLACLAVESNTELGVLEFGTWQGLTTGYLARVLPNVPIYTIDIEKSMNIGNLPPEQGPEPLPRNEIGTEYFNIPNSIIHQIIEDSMTCNFKKHIDHQLDLVLVDGNHSFSYVKNDSFKGLDLLRTDGILILHDFDMAELKSGNPLDPNRSLYGVIKFVEWTIMSLNMKWNWIKDTCLIYTVKQ